MATKGSCMCGETAYQFTGQFTFGPSGGVGRQLTEY